MLCKIAPAIRYFYEDVVSSYFNYHLLNETVMCIS